MISIEEVKKDLGEHLTDAQAENFRDALYAVVENLLDAYIESCVKLETTCKKQLSTAESQVKGKKLKDTV